MKKNKSSSGKCLECENDVEADATVCENCQDNPRKSKFSKKCVKCKRKMEKYYGKICKKCLFENVGGYGKATKALVAVDKICRSQNNGNYATLNWEPLMIIVQKPIGLKIHSGIRIVVGDSFLK